MQKIKFLNVCHTKPWTIFDEISQVNSCENVVDYVSIPIGQLLEEKVLLFKLVKKLSQIRGNFNACLPCILFLDGENSKKNQSRGIEKLVQGVVKKFRLNHTTRFSQNKLTWLSYQNNGE